MGPNEKKQDISLVVVGEAGQGIQTVKTILMDLFHHTGYSVFSTKEYMSRVRGGSNSTEIRVAPYPVSAFVDRIDIAFLLDEKAFDHVSHRITDETIIIGDKTQLSTLSHPLSYSFDLIEQAKTIGNKVYANSIAIGLLASLFQIPRSQIEKRITSYFHDKPHDIIEKNIVALKKGIEYSEALKLNNQKEKFDRMNQFSSEKHNSNVLLNGTQAISLGALAGGCNFISSYPMSPSTGVLQFLSSNGKKANVFVEQAEDEIAAVNMAIGAWYAGARALVTTSGGGFSLMGEGLSLSAMTETPLVIHLAQRPGPATGLPTRTEQGDLQLALYTGHGEFPRVIYAPGSLQEGFLLTKKAFEIADEFQIPVIVLTDEYYVDSSYQTGPFLGINETPLSHIIETTESYQRYHHSKTGVSPRGVPGFGSGFVHFDSDEHDENGRITENANVRKQMMDKRLHKQKILQEKSIRPTFFGSLEYDTLLIGWGSTRHVTEEAWNNIADGHVSYLHFSQVYPLHPHTKNYLENADHIIGIEQNATGQFARLILQETGIKIDESILQYTGFPFSVEHLEERIQEVTKRLRGK